jgi:hypothetical protein
MKIFNHPITPYSGKLRMIINYTDAEIAKYVAKYDVQDPGDCKGFSTLVEENEASLYMICIREAKWDAYTLRVLTHELFHIMTFLGECIGMEITVKNGEAFCYLYDQLFGVLYQDLLKTLGGKKR